MAVVVLACTSMAAVILLSPFQYALKKYDTCGKVVRAVIERGGGEQIDGKPQVSCSALVTSRSNYS